MMAKTIKRLILTLILTRIQFSSAAKANASYNKKVQSIVPQMGA